MSMNLSDEDGKDAERFRSFDPARRSFIPPKHQSLRDPETNPRGVRHVDETAQDRMAVTDRPRYQAAQSRRAAMIAAATRRLRGLSKRRTAPSPGDPSEPEA
jgi:hypothetical protein